MQGRLDADARTALFLYRRAANQLAYDLRVYPPPLTMSREQAERIYPLMVLIHQVLSQAAQPADGEGDKA